jgi:leader peptidase (prepilin peptidase) / N-methyltransferase
LENRWLVLLLAFLAGSLAGSIAKLIVYRAPTNLPLLKGGYKCPECGEGLALRDAVPVLSYLLGHGRRKCGHAISVREPLIELIVAVSWALTVARLGLGPELPAFLVFMTTLVILAAVDLEHRRIPNRILGPMAIVAIVLLSIAAMVQGRPEILRRSAFGALAYFAPMLLLGLVIPSSMGMGDIKLAGYLGLHLGWFSMQRVLTGAFLGFLIGAVIGVGLMAAGKKGRKDYVPFGPSMALGAAIAVLMGGSLPGGLVG